MTAFAIDGAIPTSELTTGIIVAAEKDLALARLLLHQFPTTVVLGASNSQEVGLDVFAFGIAAAGQKATVATGFDHHWRVALVADFVGLDRTLLFKGLGVLTFGITGTG